QPSAVGKPAPVSVGPWARKKLLQREHILRRVAIGVILIVVALVIQQIVRSWRGQSSAGETVLVLVEEPPPAAPGWVEAFNGTNLDGWHEVGSKGTWVADDGILRAIGRAGYLVSDRSYTDFHLKAEVR